MQKQIKKENDEEEEREKTGSYKIWLDPPLSVLHRSDVTDVFEPVNYARETNTKKTIIRVDGDGTE